MGITMTIDRMTLQEHRTLMDFMQSQENLNITDRTDLRSSCNLMENLHRKVPYITITKFGTSGYVSSGCKPSLENIRIMDVEVFVPFHTPKAATRKLYDILYSKVDKK